MVAENDKHFEQLTSSHKCVFIWPLDKTDLNQESIGFVATEEFHLEIIRLIIF